MSLRDPIVDGPAFANSLGLTPDAVRQWRARGKIQPVGTDKKGRRLYRLDDLIAAARLSEVDDDS